MTAGELQERLRSLPDAESTISAIDKLGFSQSFIAQNVLSKSGPITVAEVAKFWQGMPNKHDRKRTRQLFDLLVQAGLLETTGAENAETETWRSTAVR